MSDSDTQRKIGEFTADISTLKADMHDVKEDIGTIKDMLSQAKGGWRTLCLVAGLAGTCGAIAAYFAGWLGFLPK